MARKTTWKFVIQDAATGNTTAVITVEVQDAVDMRTALANLNAPAKTLAFLRHNGLPRKISWRTPFHYVTGTRA